MEERRDAERGDALEEWAELRIVRIEVLNAGMKLCSGKAQVFDRPLDLLDGAVAFEWIDAGETDELLWIAANNLGHGIIAQRLLAGSRLGVPGQQHPHDVLPSVVIGNLFDIAERDLLVEVLLDGRRYSRSPSINSAMGKSTWKSIARGIGRPPHRFTTTRKQ